MTEQQTRRLESIETFWHGASGRAGDDIHWLIAEVRRLQQDVAFHADCRPNRRQAEAAIADAKATNDRWADAIRERDAALAERDAAVAGTWGMERCSDCRNLFIITPYRCVTCSSERLNTLELATARADRVKAEAALTEALRVLREVEWGKSSEWCCICMNHECYGHSPNCALAAVLAQEETR